jgi:hypothetical protein
MPRTENKKYEDLISDIQENGFDAVYFTLEIGFKYQEDLSIIFFSNLMDVMKNYLI